MNFIKSKINIVILLEIIIGFVVTFIFYDKLPQQVPIHWNGAFQADNFVSKPLGAYFTPLINMVMFIFLLIVPRVDPKSQNYKDFSKIYDVFRLVLHSIFLLVQVSIVLNALKININFSFYMMILGSILAIVLGNYFSKIRFNYFFGIRTPWTLANELVWKKTHRVMGYICVLIGFLGLISVFIIDKVVWGNLMMYSIIGWAIFGFVYSYIAFRRGK